MIFKAEKLGSIGLPEEAVQRDRRSCRRAGSCGVGEKAVYLGGLYRERKYYIPYDSIERIFKRVAMSREDLREEELSLLFLILWWSMTAERNTAASSKGKRTSTAFWSR